MYRELIALGLMRHVGAVKIRKMINHTGSIDKVFQYSFKELCQIPGIGQQAAAEIRSFTDWQVVDAILKSTKDHGYGLLSITDEQYPAQLAELFDAPPILWYSGDIRTLSQRNMAVVGTRRMSSYAANETTRFTKAFTEQKLNIVSGLALGVDTCAHKVCIQNGGKTIAVLGSGFNRLYPAVNRGLAKQIVESGGCLISEYAPTTKAELAHFPTRNRLVSGLSLGVLMVESGMKGGSMITAARALDQNREVFAVPHPNGVVNGEGGNHLIKKSAAKLVQIPEDIFEEIGVIIAATNNEYDNQQNSLFNELSQWKVKDIEQPFNEQEKQILELCHDRQQSVDDLVDSTKIAFHELQQRLFGLEMAGFLKQLPGAYFRSV